jgi:hypothetical protein
VRLESPIIVATDEKKIHEEDLQFHIELLDELGGFESEEEEEEFSVEIINQVEPTGANQAVGITGATDGITTPGKPKKEDIQEARDKARAWHLDRKREKEKKEKEKKKTK